jgi:hypothetical protein
VTRTLPTASALAWHEAHHCAVLCMAGMVPKTVRTDWPDATTLGQCRIDWGDDGATREKAVHVLISVLAGPMADGETWKDNWPIDPGRVSVHARSDAEHAARLAKFLRLDHAGWLHTVWRTRRLLASPAFRRLVVVIADRLEHVEYLDADDLVQLTTEEGRCAA